MRRRLVVLAVVAASRYVAADCASGASEGYSQCQARPSCLCTYEVITCEGGGWYTHYFLDKTCVGGGTGAGSGAGSGSGSASKPPPKASPQQCTMMNKWLSEEKKFLQAYEDDDLLNLAISRGWSPGWYDDLIWRSTHPTIDPKPGQSGAVMWTNPRTCEVQNVAAGCQWLLSHGLPPIACTIAEGHEQVHAAQCRAERGNPTYDPTDLHGKRDREVEAHEQTIKDIESWLGANC